MLLAKLVKGLDIEPDEGVVRISLSHYTSAKDVNRLLEGWVASL